MSCLDVVNNLVDAVSGVNTEITVHMTNEGVRYDDACIRPDITFDFFFTSLKSKWERTINDYINKPEKCPSNMQSILLLYEVASKLNTGLGGQGTDVVNRLGSMTPQQLEQMAYDKVVDKALDILKGTSANTFIMEKDMVKTLKNLASILGDNCQCQMIDIFTFVMNKYKTRYAKKLEGKTREESISIIRQDYEYIKNTVMMFGSTFNIDKTGTTESGGVSLSMNFSIESELDKLIPNELGTMKVFFIKVIARYFNNLHPIIWAQIFKGLMGNIFNDLPMTPAELFSFVSKYLLLNAGPFVLKILQMIRPILSDELASKYNLTKLTYPLLEKNQVDIILKKVVKDYDMLKITYNKSASVGHVCIGYDVRRPNDKFVIKIVKPLAIAQSCWEYQVLHDLFEKGSCEDSFIKNTLRSNGREMNVANEIANLERGNKHYTTDYNTEFGLDIDAKLTTIAHLPGVVNDSAWFALAMTLAPGIPLADLVESKMLEADTKFRAHLHRCLDLLVVKFFYVLISQGFYHGDLHAGNVFYSFAKRQLTMIDFGAMGDIDLFANDDTTTNLLMIIIMSINYDYDGILDLLTDVLNSRCTSDKESFISKDTEAYREVKKELVAHRIKNMVNADKEKKKATKYLEDLDSDHRLSAEAIPDTLSTLKPDSEVEDREPSIYDDLDRVPESKETVVENRDILPVFTEILGDSESISFAGVMQIIVKFYAKSGVNIAIKFAELNELQKAYALLLGVLAKTGYNSYRMGMAIRSGVLSWGHLPKLLNVATTVGVVKSYWDESSKYKSLMSTIEEERASYLLKKQQRNERLAKRR
ncbi:putative protein kinase [Yasminevirus sp. GU-2018]|uniref:ABC1 atypical kinase-like domain-containing protein n=1 Tax=Yasminevirus sp. GU-2018 TaxID=2420051 RepID=A0A5K0U9L7_9VIRU|nr:putative protein kinase [Yasminevirus sp. GU-2018]